MNNIYGSIRRQNDKTLRQLQQGATAGIIYHTDPVTQEPVVSRPAVDLPIHKESNDHDDRYYTKDEMDIMLVGSGLQYDLLTNGDWDNPELIFLQGEVIWVEV